MNENNCLDAVYIASMVLCLNAIFVLQYRSMLIRFWFQLLIFLRLCCFHWDMQERF